MAAILHKLPNVCVSLRISPQNWRQRWPNNPTTTENSLEPSRLTITITLCLCVWNLELVSLLLVYPLFVHFFCTSLSFCLFIFAESVGDIQIDQSEMSNEQHKSKRYHRKLPPADTQCGYGSDTTFRSDSESTRLTRQDAYDLKSSEMTTASRRSTPTNSVGEDMDIFNVEEGNTTVVQKGARKANPREAEPMTELQLLVSHLIKSQELSEARYERDARERRENEERKERERLELEDKRERDRQELEDRRERDRREFELRREQERKEERLRHEDELNLKQAEFDKIRNEQLELEAERRESDRLYKDPGQIGMYLDKFTRIMTECQIPKKDWTFYLTTKLPERLCVRIGPLLDSDADFQTVCSSLLESEGETETSFASKLFALNPDFFKTMSGIQIAEHTQRLVKGWLTKAHSFDDVYLIWTKAFIKQNIPNHGRVFLEGREINTFQGLCTALTDWLNTRAPNNFF